MIQLELKQAKDKFNQLSVIENIPIIS